MYEDHSMLAPQLVPVNTCGPNDSGTGTPFCQRTKKGDEVGRKHGQRRVWRKTSHDEGTLSIRRLRRKGGG